MKFWQGVVLVVIVSGVLVYGVIDSRRYLGVLQVSMMDVGQGDAVLITDPAGFQVLIDGGPNNGAIVRQLEHVMPIFDRSIDVVVLTHPDADHVGGLADVLDRYHVSTIVDNAVPKKTEDALEFRSKSLDEGADIRSVYAGQSIRTPGGLVFDVLSPHAGSHEEEVNEYSITMRLRYGDISYLFTGDIGSTVEERLIASYADAALQSTVLKVPHHGSRFSSSLGFVKAVAPRLAIASYACENSYGHPAGATVRRYQYVGVPVYTTCDRGTFTLVSDGADIWLR
jgi:competence protein ComEC